jgi:short-subunit dehydrogenase
MRKILIIGATSSIAQQTARLFADAGDTLYLVARNSERLDTVANDLRLRGANGIHTKTLDTLQYDKHKSTIIEAGETLDGIDIVIIAHGTLPDQSFCEQSFEQTRKEFEVNALSTISLLTHLANYFENKKSGMIVVITSVAGDRGRKSNYIYGSAKSAVTTFLQGLRNRLHTSGVRVLTVKPGFVDTPMTSQFKKGMLWVSPDTVAAKIVKAINNKNKNVAYIPWFWWHILTILKMMPEVVFKRLSL